MLPVSDLSRALDALQYIPADTGHDEWLRALMAAHAAGVPEDEAEAWSAQAPSFDARTFRAKWRSIKTGGGIGPGTLFKLAAEHGYGKRRSLTLTHTRSGLPRTAPEPRTAPRQGEDPSAVWNRCIAAPSDHPYIVAKAGLPDGLRVVPAGDPLRIMGESMAGALVVPVLSHDGSIASLQFITTGEVAQRLGKGKAKPNLPRASLQEGWFTVGTLNPAGVAYVGEGIGSAWSCWKATGCAGVVCFGWGRVRAVATKLRELHPALRLVLVPDVGKEDEADEIALAVGALVARMPEGWPENSDVNDLAKKEGGNVVEALLSNASAPPEREARFRLLSGADLSQLPPLSWRVRGVLPAAGIAAIYGPSASGKSFLAFDSGCAIAEGRPWFGFRTVAAPVVYAALEGEAGLRLRAEAWSTHTGRKLPDAFRLMLQPFKLTESQDVADLAAVVPAGAVVFVDTLNRAAPTADENSSRDMGEILEAAKRLQTLTGGLVVLVHHTGKDATKGLRGHSSLFAALDAAIEVARDASRREWRVAKSKDGQDGDAHPFKLQTEMLGTDDHGEPVTSCVVVPDTTAKDVQRVKLPQGGNQRLALEALRPMFKGGERGKPGAPPQAGCIELEAAISAVAPKLLAPM